MIEVEIPGDWGIKYWLMGKKDLLIGKKYMMIQGESRGKEKALVIWVEITGDLRRQT